MLTNQRFLGGSKLEIGWGEEEGGDEVPNGFQ